MPSLTDLPPELIVRIYHEHDQLLLAELPSAEQDQAIGVATQLVPFRLTNRYIELATRRSFVENYFAAWHITAPNDAEIQKFCTMAKTPYLAAAIVQLNFCVDDDYSMRVQDTVVAPSGSDIEATHVFDDTFGALVPAAYFRNRDALVEAFRACVNVYHLRFSNKPINLDGLERYKYECLSWDDEDEDEDEDDESEDGSDDDEGEAEGEDEGEDVDAMDIDDQDVHVAENDDYDAMHVDDNLEQEVVDGSGSEDRDEQAEGYREGKDLLYDITSSYNYVFFLSERAVCVQVGLTDCAGLKKFKSAFKKLEGLHLSLLENQYGHTATSEEIGQRLGRQMSAGLSHMPMVRLLSVEFHHTTSSGAWRALAKAPVIPMLEKLRLETCTMKMHDFAEFFGKHSPTCKVLIMGYVQLTNGSMEDLGRLYELLSQAPKIEEYYQGSQFLGAEDEYLTFPPGSGTRILRMTRTKTGLLRSS